MATSFGKNKIIIAIALISIFLTLGLAGFYGAVREKGAAVVAKPGQMRITEVGPGEYSFKTLDNNLIEIGNEKSGQPSLKLNKWDGEVSMKIGFPDVAGAKPNFDGQKLTYSTTDRGQVAWWQKLLPDLFASADAQQADKSKMDIAFYPRQPEQIAQKNSDGSTGTITINEDGGVEFDTILYEKPNNNAISYPIETQNLDFFYQAPLNQENKDETLVCTETECKDKDGNIVSYRPENVVGSYAVYYKDGKFGDYSQMGGKNYKTGKAFHVYRPKVTDAVGKETWGELHIDTAANILTVIVPQEFLDAAAYPVKIDPTFGYTTIGGGENSAANAVRASYFVGSPGTVDKMTAYVFATAYYPQTLSGKIYLYSDGSLIQTAGPVSVPTSTPGWIDLPIATSPTISGVNYWLGVWGSYIGGGYVRTRYDTGSANQGGYQSGEPSTFSPTLDNNKYSIYATYSTHRPTITSVSLDMSDPKVCKIIGSDPFCNSGPGITFNSVASDPDTGDSIKLYVCKENFCQGCGPDDTGSCWAYSDSASTTNPKAVFDYLNAPPCGGDAKWSPWPVDADASHVYHFQDRYKSDVETVLLVQYRDGNGVYSWPGLADLPPSAGWSTAQADIYPPEGTVSLTVLHLITDVGYLTTDNFKLTQDSDTTNLFANPGVETDSDSDGTPDYWSNNYWGDVNQPVFSYPVSGDGGGRAIEVQVMSLRLGNSTCRYCVDCGYWAKVCDNDDNCSTIIGQ